MSYLKAIKYAIEQESLRKKLAPKCHICGSKKNLQKVPTIGVYYECKKCWRGEN